MANANCKAARGRKRMKRKAKMNSRPALGRTFSACRVLTLCGSVLGLLLCAGMLFAAEAERQRFIARAEAELHRAQKQFEADTNDVAAAVRFARAGFDFADITTNDAARAAVAREGIAVCRRLIEQNPKLAAGHYYLAANLGELARTELFGALKIVKEMAREFKTADDLDEHLDYAGPARSLGLLYRDAPGWPASIGSRRKARFWLERAVKLAPDFPENRLDLAESYLEWKELNRAQAELDDLDTLWPKARTNFTGEAWAPDWDDWTTRRDNARKRLIAVPGPPRLPGNGR